MARKTQAERASELDSSFLRLIAPSGYTFEWLHQVVRAVKYKGRVESSFQSETLRFSKSYLYDNQKYIILFFSKNFICLRRRYLITFITVFNYGRAMTDASTKLLAY